MFFGNESIYSVWHKLDDIERRLSQGGDWFPSRRQYDSMGRSAWESSSFNGNWWNTQMTRVERVRRALELSGSSARQLMARQLSGLDLSAIWPILLEACQDIALYYGSSVIAGAALGSFGGAFFGGVGAVPGAALGATAGAQVGGWVLGLLGLKSLAEDLSSAFSEALNHYERGFREAWGPTHRDRRQDVLGLHTGSGDPQTGAWYLAQGHVVLVMALLTALVAWLMRGKGDKAVLLQEIRQSRRLGPRVADWVAQNEGKLINHPHLQPRKNAAVPERPIMQERASKAGSPEPDKPKPAGSGGDVGANNINRLTPRVDVADQFSFKSFKNGNVELSYGNPESGHGLFVNVDKNGLLGFDIRAQGNVATQGSGRDMFIGAMSRLEQEGVQVNKIRGFWVEGTDSVNNAQYFNNLKTMSPQQAAANTWTGRIASDYGFTKVESVQTKYGNTTVIFGK